MEMVYENVVAVGSFYFAHVATDALRSEHLFATISHTQATDRNLPRTAPFLETIVTSAAFNHSLSPTILLSSFLWPAVILTSVSCMVWLPVVRPYAR